MLKVNSEKIPAFAASHKHLPGCNIKVTKSHHVVDLDTCGTSGTAASLGDLPV